jgi:hypothetical protein
MERVLEHDPRCENLGFSVMILSNKDSLELRSTRYHSIQTLPD